MATLPTAGLSLASIPEFPSFGESVLFQLNGLVVVFLALGSIWALMEMMGWFFRRAERAKPVPAAPPVAAAAEPSTVSASAGPSQPEVFALIAAAVHVSLEGRRHRISAIVPIDADLDWAREGRRTIFASHKTR